MLFRSAAGPQQLIGAQRGRRGEHLAMLQYLVQANNKHAMSCDRKFWCHAQAKARASAGHAHTTKALAVPPALAAMGYEPANGGWQLRPDARNFY